MVTQIALFGGQPMPNVIAALMCRTDKVVCCVSADSKNQFQGFKSLMGRHGISAVMKVVNPYDMKLITDRLKEIISSENVVSANITGGTKPMALALYVLAMSEEIPVCYVVTETGKIYHYSGLGETQERPIEVSLNVGDCLDVQSFNVEDRPASATKPDLASQFGLEYARFSRGLLWMKQVLMAKKDSPGQSMYSFDLAGSSSSAREILRACHSHGIVRSLSINGTRTSFQVPVAYKQFLTGIWLETYVYNRLKNSNAFDDCRHSVSIIHRETAIRNEIDIMLTSNAVPAVISCKTGKQNRPDRQWLAELDERARPLGRYCRRILVTTAPRFTGDFLARARSMNIICLGADDLPHLVERVSGVMAGEGAKLD